MSRWIGGFLILCVLSQPAVLFGQEGSLGKIRADVKGNDDSSDKGKKNEQGKQGDDCDGLFDSLFAGLFGGLFRGDFDNYDLRGYFPIHPYAEGRPGYMWIRRDVDENSEPPPQPDFTHAKGWGGRIAIEESNDFDNINRASLRLLLETGSGLGIQTNWSWVHETLPCGCSDNSALGDVNITFLFIQQERLQMRAGLGVRLITDRYITDAGFNATWSADWYPCKPLVISTTIDGGTLGHAGVFRAQGSIGYLFKRWEIYTGYDYLRIGSTALQGPILGLRLWF